MSKKVRALHEKREFIDVREMVEFVGEEFKDRIAFKFRKKPHDKEPISVSYPEFRENIRALATEMHSMDLHGKHCIVIGKHSYGWIRLYFSLLSVGAVLVPLDRDWAEEDLIDTVAKADASYIFADLDIKEKVTNIAAATGTAAPIWIDGEGEGSVDAMQACGKAKLVLGDRAYFDAKIDTDALSCLVFTSGTTGKGKGVMLSQRNFISDLADVIPFIDFSVKCISRIRCSPDRT